MLRPFFLSMLKKKGPLENILFLTLRFSVGSLLTILCFLSSRTATVCSRNVLLLFGFSLYLIFFRTSFWGTFKDNTAFKNLIKFICHITVD